MKYWQWVWNQVDNCPRRDVVFTNAMLWFGLMRFVIWWVGPRYLTDTLLILADVSSMVLLTALLFLPLRRDCRCR